MKLDNDEKYIFTLKPDRKILISWFFAKTTTYSFSILFIIFMLLFVFNTTNEIDVALNKASKESEVSSIAPSNSKPAGNEIIKVEHPFTIFIEYWVWAIFLNLLLMMAIQIYLMYLRKTYSYIITNKRCIFIGGIIKRVERSVPYKKITDIQRTQNILERILGIWNIQVFTPGTASMVVGQRKAQAELNFDGLLESEEALAAINKYIQECS